MSLAVIGWQSDVIRGVVLPEVPPFVVGAPGVHSFWSGQPELVSAPEIRRVGQLLWKGTGARQWLGGSMQLEMITAWPTWLQHCKWHGMADVSWACGLLSQRIAGPVPGTLC
ncbi:hypothetical protein KIL84_015662 [Mauremys mutica]|uniref:Uncharacterized protein n=1 Tax=Mauremys mutica TaxID=74926 RepID=A0A9D3WSX3_9SAUR|nr:hypothetical protein KIL84_015662 [Mauremys mutica]